VGGSSATHPHCPRPPSATPALRQALQVRVWRHVHHLLGSRHLGRRSDLGPDHGAGHRGMASTEVSTGGMRFPRPCRELLQVRQGVQHGRCPSHGPSPQGGVLMERRGRCCVHHSQECRHNGAHPHTSGLQPALTALLLQGQHPLAFFSRPTNASSSASSSPSATGAHTSGAAASW